MKKRTLPLLSLAALTLLLASCGGNNSLASSSSASSISDFSSSFVVSSTSDSEHSSSSIESGSSSALTSSTVLSSSSDSSSVTSSTASSSAVSSSSSSSSAVSSSSSSSSAASSSSSSSSAASSSSSSATDVYYESARGLKGPDLKAKLKVIISAHIAVSYDWSRFEAADESPTDSTSVLCVYSRKNEKKTAHVNSAHVGWNREHSFPQSKMSSTESKKDDHLIFASDCEVNGKRSNYKLGLVAHSENARVIDSYGNSTDCFLVGTTFEPCDEARGEVARASLYGAVLYGYDLAENFTSQALCLDWNKSHPISEREKRRNNVLQKLQMNRNPFTDHPEFAKMIYDSSYTGAGALNDTSF